MCQLLSRMYLGMITTIGGTIKVLITARKRRSRPGKRIRAKAYAAIASMMARPMIQIAATNALLKNHRAIGVPTRVRYASNVGFSGQSMVAQLRRLASTFVLSDVASANRNGTNIASATAMSTT